MSQIFPTAVLECFLEHTKHVEGLSLECKNFLNSFLGVNIVTINIGNYLRSPANVASARQLLMSNVTKMSQIDTFVQNHDSLRPGNLSGECSSVILDESYFIYRGWGYTSPEDSMFMDIMTSFSFKKDVAEQFSHTGQVTTVKMTQDVLNNSLYIGELARVRQEEEMLLFPGVLTRVGDGDLYTYTPYSVHHLRDKINDRRPVLGPIMDAAEARRKDIFISRAEKLRMKHEDTRSWIVNMYQSLYKYSKSGMTHPPVTVTASNDNISTTALDIIKPLYKEGMAIDNIFVNMEGIITGDIGGHRIRMIVDVDMPDASMLYIPRDGMELELYVLGLKYNDQECDFYN